MVHWLFKKMVIVGTGFVFFVFWLFSLLAQVVSFKAVDPVGEALADFKLTDMIYADPEWRQVTSGYKSDIDSNICVVNIGRTNRDTVGMLIRRINEFSPAVIGVDVVFGPDYGPERDSLLVNALKNSRAPVVMGSDLQERVGGSLNFGRLSGSHQKFTQYTDQGFVNINNQEALRTIRDISPVAFVNGDTVPGFSVAIMRHFRPEAAAEFVARGNDIELINWRGSQGSFFLQQYKTLLDTSLGSAVDEALRSTIEGKIVLLAFVDQPGRLGSLEDRYFTPLNEQFAGKSIPDLYGIYIHANTLSMMMAGNYVNVTSPALALVLAIVVCWLLTTGLTWLHLKRPLWFDLITRSSQVALSLLILFVIIYLFAETRYELDADLILLVIVLGPDILELFFPFYERLKLDKRIPNLPNPFQRFKSQSS